MRAPLSSERWLRRPHRPTPLAPRTIRSHVYFRAHRAISSARVAATSRRRSSSCLSSSPRRVRSSDELAAQLASRLDRIASEENS